MERWVGKVAVVTGASAGIGAAIAKDLVSNGMNVVGVARRVERVQELESSLSGAKGKLYPLKGDVTKEEDVKKIFDYVRQKFGAVHVLVNNAGLSREVPMAGGADNAAMRLIFETNVFGLFMCTNAAMDLMKETGSISPGYVDTEILEAAGMKEIEEQLAGSPSLDSKEIANAVTHVLSVPANVQRWVGKVAVVTGASAGIGAAIAKDLVSNGMNVVGVARRVERVQELESSLSGAKGKLYPLKGDVTKEEDVKKIFDYVRQKFGAVHVLVNNAGLSREVPMAGKTITYLKLLKSKYSHWINLLQNYL
ncbi:hypothetical protein J437_LFUL018546 [Ladona fulva]|uniref:Farnesol dehydrogenase n=1 Tax=Ladona fulva TaxID=123851 RepID=A0A8K0P5E5_LADFU|nr:hypothetical protein J437_LFUL018546 [Ladona fulva]